MKLNARAVTPKIEEGEPFVRFFYSRALHKSFKLFLAKYDQRLQQSFQFYVTAVYSLQPN